MSSDELSPLRLGRITGSRIGSILGRKRASSTRPKVLREMVRQYLGLPDLFQGNDMTQYGKDHEADGIAEYEDMNHVLVYGRQDFVVHPFYDFLGVSLDGRVGKNGILEIKVPSVTARYKSIADKPSFEDQLRLGMDCCGAAWGDLGMWWEHKPMVVNRLEYDPSWLPSVLPELRRFMDDYLAAINNPVVLAEELGRGKVVDLDKYAADVALWRQKKAEGAAVTSEIEEIKERLAAAMGDAEIAALAGSPALKWSYRAGANTFDRPAFKEDHPDMESQYSKTGEPTRSLSLIEGEVA
jgi:hypothetical protein